MELYDLGREVISAEQPAGSDIAYDDDYEKLTVEIKKLSSPTADSAIDWSRVTELSRKILAEKSKNLQVACYLCIALCNTDGLQGCATGVHVLRGLLDNFWDSLYPPKKRKKGRINALRWWNEKVRDFVETLEPKSWEVERRDEFLDDLSGLDSLIAEKLPDGPILRPLMETISDLVLDATSGLVVEGPEQEETVVASSLVAGEDHRSPAIEKETTAVPIASVPAAVPVDENSDANDYFASGMDYLGEAATKFFVQDSHRPLSYQLTRLAAWGQIDSTPLASKGKTMLPSPDDQVMTLLTGQYESGMWAALLSSAEGHVRQYLFWLDLNFWVATALEQLEADTAAMSVANDTLLFVRLFPALETLSFADGMPFAGEETREWLRDLRHSGGDEKAVVSVDSSAEADGREATSMQIMTEKGLAAALHYLQENSGSLRSGKEQFIHDLISCRLMLKGKQAELSRPFAERLLRQVDAMGLEAWDPDLAFAALSSVYKSFKLTAQEAVEQQTTALRDRLTLLAPENALNLI